MTIREAIEAVVNECKNPYAQTYAKAALELGESTNVILVTRDKLPGLAIAHEKTGKMMIGRELKVQILYILSNLGSWRGDRAREVKTILKTVTRR